MARNSEQKTSDLDVDKRKITKDRIAKTFEIFKFLNPYKGRFLVGFLFLILSSVTVLIFPFLAGKLLDVATGKSITIFQNINQICIVLLAVLFLQAIFSYYRVILFSQVSEKAMFDLRRSIYSKIIRMPMVFFEKRRVGELMSRITSDVLQLQDVLSITLAEFFRQVSVLLIGLVIISITSSKLSLFMILTFPVLVLLAFVFGRSIRGLSKKTQDELASAHSIAEEGMHGIQVIKVFTNENYEISRYSKALQRVKAVALKGANRRAAFISFIIFVLFGGIVLVLWYGAVLVRDKEISIGDLTSFILYTSFIGASIAGLGDLYSQLQKTIGSSERILEILEEKNESSIDGDGEAKKYKGKINFTNVFFSYPSRLDVQVLKGINIEIQPGEKVAIVGKSGAGKTTLMQLLLKFHHIDTGSILIDDTNIDGLSIVELRKNIGIVPQDTLLFGGTIRENIAYGKPEASLAEIHEAAEKAQAMGFIVAFPEGMETVVGERGIKLSGGQKQRIAIARAILKNPSILLLDEATSALDSESEKLVQLGLDELMKNRTSIMIAHRLSTVRKANKIVVLDKGVIVESGSHTELAQKEDGIYNKLLKMQNELIDDYDIKPTYA